MVEPTTRLSTFQAPPHHHAAPFPPPPPHILLPPRSPQPQTTYHHHNLHLQTPQAESKGEGKYDEAEAKGGEAKGGGGGFINVKVQNSDKIVLFEGEVASSTTLETLATKYLPETPEGQSYSLYEVRSEPFARALHLFHAGCSARPYYRAVHRQCSSLFFSFFFAGVGFHTLRVPTPQPHDGVTTNALRCAANEQGAVKCPQSSKLSDLTDESFILLNASYKVSFRAMMLHPETLLPSPSEPVLPCRARACAETKPSPVIYPHTSAHTGSSQRRSRCLAGRGAEEVKRPPSAARARRVCVR